MGIHAKSSRRLAKSTRSIPSELRPPGVEHVAVLETFRQLDTLTRFEASLAFPLLAMPPCGRQ
jgi:hypothetical protein